MRKIQTFASYFFIIAVAILTVISIMGIWKVFDTDVIFKSFQTLGLLAVVAIIVMIAGQYMEGKSHPDEPVLPSPVFISIRKATLVILIVAVSFLALLGILSIWDVIADKDILYKSLGSLATLAFSSFLIVMTCMGQEGSLIMGAKNTQKKSLPSEPSSLL